jgi:outer membrane protein OmpA-like peptidoglycan-associated protein/tetratricopeptide (TPR) repeat protein
MLPGNAQKSELRKAVSYFDRGEYFLSLDYYKKAEGKGAVLDNNDKKRKARCYYYLNDIDNAFNLFSEIQDNLSGNDVFLYASTNHKFGFYQGAIEWYEKSKSQGANPVQVNELINSCKWAEENQIFVNYLVNPASLATFGQSFGIQYYKDGVVYSSAEEGDKKVDKQGKSILNLYFSDIQNGDIQQGSRLFSKNLQFPSHVGAISFTSDFKYMYFTKAVRIKNGSSRIKIFMVEYDGRDWVNETEIAINSDDFDCAHPAISPDDKYIFFVSNKKGGFGGKDLYYAERKGPNSFGTVQNLGNQVNTFGDEMFPFVGKDNKLYFSSDGHYGFGGLDIFSAEFVDGQWGNVTNLMKPFNSNRDDFGYVIDPNNADRGFLSSNNFGNAASDVIFYVRKTKPEEKTSENLMPIAGLENIVVQEEPVQEVVEPAAEPKKVDTSLPGVLNTTITSTFNGDLVEGADVVLYDPATGAVIARGVTGANGKCSITVPDQYRVDGQEFELVVSKGNLFQSKRMIINIMEIDDINSGGIQLTPIFNDAVLDDISSLNFLYTGNELSGDALKVLDKLASYMLSNPSIVIKINGHTEARGNRFDNLDKSQKMADSVKAYLVSKGIDQNRLIPRGYGERYLLNKCRRGIYCEMSAHALNRRVEFAVWNLLK